MKKMAIFPFSEENGSFDDDWCTCKCNQSEIVARISGYVQIPPNEELLSLNKTKDWALVQNAALVIYIKVLNSG